MNGEVNNRKVESGLKTSVSFTLKELPSLTQMIPRRNESSAMILLKSKTDGFPKSYIKKHSVMKNAERVGHRSCNARLIRGLMRLRRSRENEKVRFEFGKKSSPRAV